MIQKISQTEKFFAETSYQFQQNFVNSQTEQSADFDLDVDRSDRPVEASEEKSSKNSDTTSKNVVDYRKLSDTFQEILGDSKLGVEFRKDEETQIMTVNVIDRETKEIVRQIPPEVTIKIAKMVSHLSASETGNITNAKI